MVGLLSENGLHPLDVMKVCTDVPEVDEDVLGAIAVVTLLGAAIVADNGAASDSNAKRIEKCGLSYVTRVEINKSDLRNIDEHASEFEYVGGGVQCYKHHLASSGRTTFLFLSRDLLEIGRHKARRRLEKVLGMYENVKNGNLRKSDYVRSQRCLRSAWMSL